MEIWNTYIEANKDRFISELKELLAIPSVSTNENYKGYVNRCAEWVKDALIAAGCDFAEVSPTANHPVVYGQRIIDETKPTILVYGHYDVQPSEPDDLWETRPFEPAIRDGKIFARGASDDKGQVFMHIKALETMSRTSTLPCNFKFIIEGEEEVGSTSLPDYLQRNKKSLAADVVLVSDTAMLDMKHPSVDIGLRGLAYLEITLTGPDHDLHSGVYGGAVGNPINLLCRMIGRLFNSDNQIAIPGFYDKVRKLTPEERARIELTPYDRAEYLAELGITEVFGEKGFSTLERTGIRPSLDVNGIWGGYTEKGAKTVLPSKAHAKISMRLVPDQQPEEIAALFADYIQKITPPCVKTDIVYLHGAEPVVTPEASPGFAAASKAIRTTFGKDPIPVYSGGSIPVVALFKKILNVDTVLLGFGLDNDHIHSPNEKFDLFNFFKGIETIAYYARYFSGINND